MKPTQPKQNTKIPKDTVRSHRTSLRRITETINIPLLHLTAPHTHVAVLLTSPLIPRPPIPLYTPDNDSLGQTTWASVHPSSPRSQQARLEIFNNGIRILSGSRAGFLAREGDLNTITIEIRRIRDKQDYMNIFRLNGRIHLPDEEVWIAGKCWDSVVGLRSGLGGEVGWKRGKRMMCGWGGGRQGEGGRGGGGRGVEWCTGV